MAWAWLHIHAALGRTWKQRVQVRVSTGRSIHRRAEHQHHCRGSRNRRSRWSSAPQRTPGRRHQRRLTSPPLLFRSAHRAEPVDPDLHQPTYRVRRAGCFGLEPTRPSGSVRGDHFDAASVMAIVIMSAPVFALVKAAVPWREYLHGGTRRRCREDRQPDPNPGSLPSASGMAIDHRAWWGWIHFVPLKPRIAQEFSFRFPPSSSPYQIIVMLGRPGPRSA